MTSLRLSLAAAAVAIAGFAGAATAMPNDSISLAPDAAPGSAVETVASKFCYPRIVWTYVRGVGPRRIIAGLICLPMLVERMPHPGPGPDPGPLQRIGPRL